MDTTKVEAFIADLHALCVKHNATIRGQHQFNDPWVTVDGVEGINLNASSEYAFTFVPDKQGGDPLCCGDEGVRVCSPAEEEETHG